MSKPPALACLTLVLMAGCASAPSGPARSQRVAYVEYRSGARFELVNETHTGRVEQYSEVRTNASRKVQTDEVVGGLVELMRERGFDRLARPGPAPRASDGQIAVAIEIEDGDRVEHVLGVKGMPAEDRQAVLLLAQSLIDIYNATYGLQAVDKPPTFENPVGPTRHKPPKVQVGGSQG